MRSTDEVGPATPKREEVARLFETEAEEIRQYLERRTGSPADASEMLSAVFECAVRSSSEELSTTITRAWLYTVAKRRSVDHWRKTNRRAEVALQTSQLRPECSVEDEVAARLTVDQTLAELDLRHRFVLERKYIDGNSVAEIASFLGVSVRAAESTLARARRQVRVQSGRDRAQAA